MCPHIFYIGCSEDWSQGFLRAGRRAPQMGLAYMSKAGVHLGGIAVGGSHHISFLFFSWRSS